MIADIEPDNANSHERGSILLIDLENCPNQINQLKNDLEQYQKVIICYAKSETKVPIDWLMPLSAMIHADKLKIFKMPSSGKNAADFGISFYAGILTQQFHQTVDFIIVSNDKDLDHVVNLLNSQGFSAKRIGTKQEVKIATDDLSKETSAPIKICCQHLIKNIKNRPTKQETLLNSIKNKLKTSTEQAAEVMQLLVTAHAISFANKKVTYYDKKINALADE